MTASRNLLLLVQRGVTHFEIYNLQCVFTVFNMLLEKLLFFSTVIGALYLVAVFMTLPPFPTLLVHRLTPLFEPNYLRLSC